MRAGRWLTEKLPKPLTSSLALYQRIGHGLEDGLDRELGVALSELGKAGCQGFYQVAAWVMVMGRSGRSKKRPRARCAPGPAPNGWN